MNKCSGLVLEYAGLLVPLDAAFTVLCLAFTYELSSPKDSEDIH